MSGCYVRVGKLTPWAEGMLSRAEVILVRKSKVTSVSGKSARGPWKAVGPGGTCEGPHIRQVINAAAGETLV
jgi:hypothetical protein